MQQSRSNTPWTCGACSFANRPGRRCCWICKTTRSANEAGAQVGAYRVVVVEVTVVEVLLLYYYYYYFYYYNYYYFYYYY
jgi:hypothetical protein